jgi:hypothetical protein
MPWLVYLIVLLVAALAGLTALILAIVFLFKGSFKRAAVPGGVFVLMVVLGIFSVAGLVGKAIGTGIGAVSERVRERVRERRRAFQQRVDRLKSYIDPSVRDKVEDKFFTEKGFRDWWRFPLVYPYSITCIDTLEDGSLGLDGHLPSGWTEIDPVSEITHLTFDGKYLLVRAIARTEPAPDPDTGYVYCLFEFRTGKREQFKTREELFAAAKKRGFTGELVLITVEGAFEQYFGGSHDGSQDLR